jgi:hypothetical protein
MEIQFIHLTTPKNTASGTMSKPLSMSLIY